MNNQILFFVLVGATVSLNALAQVLLKVGSVKSFFNIYLLGGILAYGLSTLIYIKLLSKVNLSLAYPLIIGLTVIVATVSGVALLGEKVQPISWVGVGLVLSGIWAIAVGKP
jgi:small multidrug resistance pump